MVLHDQHPINTHRNTSPAALGDKAGFAETPARPSAVWRLSLTPPRGGPSGGGGGGTGKIHPAFGLYLEFDGNKIKMKIEGKINMK